MIAVVGTLAIVAVTVAIGVFVDRKTSIVPAVRPAAPSHTAGEAPASAIRAGATQLARLRASQRCPACRAAMLGAPDDAVRYGERSLLVLQFRCPACAARRALYVEPAA